MLEPTHWNQTHDSITWLREQWGNMVELLGTLVNIDSGTGDHDGVGEVSQEIENFLVSHEVSVNRINADKGVILNAAPASLGKSDREWLLMGHMDTVFPTGTASKRPFRVQDNFGYGPGVADMKAGLVLNCFVLAAISRSNGPDFPRVSAIFTCDEEIASPFSRQYVETAARQADFVLNSEPGRANGDIVLERKGGLFLTITVNGKAAHAGVDFKNGASAIEELAIKVTHLRKIGQSVDGITLNVGVIRGGETVNTVADQAEARIDLRYMRSNQRSKLIEMVQNVAVNCEVPGTQGDFRIDGEFLPMTSCPESMAMLATYQKAAQELGFMVEGTATGGCSDAGFSAAVGTPTLCGMGPIGSRAHTEREYCDLSSLVPRAQAMVSTILNHAVRSEDPSAPG